VITNGNIKRVEWIVEMKINRNQLNKKKIFSRKMEMI
jgi:hypothetical protein